MVASLKKGGSWSGRSALPVLSGWNSESPSHSDSESGGASPRRGTSPRGSRRTPSISSGSRFVKSGSFSRQGHHHDLDPEHDMESLMDITDRCENKVGVVQISSRYHRFHGGESNSVRRLNMDYATTTTVLGTGYNGEVRLAHSKERPDLKFAVKAFDFTGVPAQRRVQLESEVEVFLRMDHPHVARLVDVYEMDGHMDLVMECMEGGELLDRIRERKRFPEKETAQHVWQMLLALNYIHSHGMIHCDLKLENFMYDHVDDNHLKLIDFGFSKMCDNKSELKRKACGTLSYTAPEVLDWSYTQQCDQWSLGVIVFVLLAGYMPFSGPELEQMKCISAGRYVMKEERWSTVSGDAKHFVQSLLEVDPKKRLTAEAALEHPFLKSRHEEEAQVDASVVKALRDYGHQSRFRRCCMSMMAWSLSNEERERVEKYFLAMDTRHHGAIVFEDLKKVMVDKFHLPCGEVKKAFQALDTSHHKEIHFSDFLAAMISSQLEVHEALMHEAFRKFDADNSGYIDANNLRTVLGETFEGIKVEKLLGEADTLHHGKLSYHEFASYLTNRELKLHGDEAIDSFPQITESRAKLARCQGGVQPCCSLQ